MSPLQEKIIEYIKNNPGISDTQAAKNIGCNRESVRTTRHWMAAGMPERARRGGKKGAVHATHREWKKKPGSKTIRVKCLGHLEPEHYFESADPRYNRICPQCRDGQRYLGGGLDG